jgi:hypothetical protein
MWFDWAGEELKYGFCQYPAADLYDHRFRGYF